MINQQLRSYLISFRIVFVTLTVALVMTACSSDKSKAKALVAEYMTGQGTTDIVVDYFHKSQKTPDKAYTGATVTYKFASSDGKPQREFLGFVLTKSGDGWRIERSAQYTTDDARAETIIAGGK